MSVWPGIAFQCDRAKKKMQELGAVSEETAKTPEELGIPKHILNHFLAARAFIDRARV